MRILLQGIIYFFDNHVCFHSYFNDTTIFGADPTILIIRLDEILSISKQNVAYLFPTAIEIEGKSGKKHFFTSFLTRDRVYQELMNLWNTSTASLPGSLAVTQSDTAKQLECMSAHELSLPLSCKPFPLERFEDFPQRSLEHTFPCFRLKMPLPEFVPMLSNVEDPECILRKMLIASGASNISRTNWSNPIEFESGSTAQCFVRYIYPVRLSTLTNLLCTQKKTEVEALWTFYCYSPTSCIIEMQSNALGIPFNKTFRIVYRYCFNEDENGLLQFDIEYAYQSLQATVFRAIIEKEILAQYADSIRFLQKLMLETFQEKGYSPQSHQLVMQKFDLVSFKAYLKPLVTYIQSLGALLNNAGFAALIYWAGLVIPIIAFYLAYNRVSKLENEIKQLINNYNLKYIDNTEIAPSLM